MLRMQRNSVRTHKKSKHYQASALPQQGHHHQALQPISSFRDTHFVAVPSSLPVQPSHKSLQCCYTVWLPTFPEPHPSLLRAGQQVLRGCHLLWSGCSTEHPATLQHLLLSTAACPGTASGMLSSATSTCQLQLLWSFIVDVHNICLASLFINRFWTSKLQ